MNQGKMAGLNGSLEMNLAPICFLKKVSKDISPEVKVITLLSLKSKEVLRKRISAIANILVFWIQKIRKMRLFYIEFAPIVVTSLCVLSVCSEFVF